MFENVAAFSGFAVDDIDEARRFYQGSLGLTVSEEHGMLHLHLAGGTDVLVYPKPGHQPADYTMLNFPVENIEQAVDALIAAGVTIERFDGMTVDQRGIFRETGPYIAWYRDPAGNILSVLQER